MTLLDIFQRERAGAVISLRDPEYPKIAALNQIKSDVNVSARALRNVVIFTDGAEIAKALDRLQGAIKSTGERLQALEAGIWSDQGKAQLAKVVQARAALIPLQEKFVELVRSGKADAAKAMLLSDIRAVQSSYLAALDDAITFQHGLMEESARLAATAS